MAANEAKGYSKTIEDSLLMAPRRSRCTESSTPRTCGSGSGADWTRSEEKL